jgi:outer membrane murein-binding lipoprotein Lpp
MVTIPKRLEKGRYSLNLTKRRIMKHTYFILMAIVFIAGSVVAGCNVNREKKVEDAKENVKEADRNLINAQDQYEKDWQQFKNEAESKIAANEKSIDEFKAEMKTASNKFKTKYEKEVMVLEQKNIELKKKISEYKYEGKDKWEEFKKGFNRDVDIVGNALKDIFAKKD